MKYIILPEEFKPKKKNKRKKAALTQNRTMDLQIFSLTLSQLSYQGVFLLPVKCFLCIKYKNLRLIDCCRLPQIMKKILIK